MADEQQPEGKESAHPAGVNPKKPKQPDSKYIQLVKWAYQRSEYKLQSQELEATARSFLDNIDRLRAVSLMPAVIAAHAMGKGDVREGLAAGSMAAESYIEVIPVVRDGFKPLYSSVIIGAWTAFESLATDLWIKALNIRPKKLGLKALKSQHRGQDSTDRQHPPNKPHTLSVDLVAKYNFDLKAIGHILWRERQFDFNSFYQLKATYKAVFDEAEKWFSGKTPQAMVYLEAMRQVLVHRGGRVDHFFEERVTKHPVLSKLRIDDDIQSVIDARLRLSRPNWRWSLA